MPAIKIDRSKHLCDEPSTGHNRWHPEIAPKLEVGVEEEVSIETRDSADGYFNPSTTIADFSSFPLGALHPLTGPIAVKGAAPGDLLEVEFLDITPAKWGFSCIFPGLGFLRDLFPAPFIAHWDLDGEWATSKQIPGVRVPGAPFMGICGVAPSSGQVDMWKAREADVAAGGGAAFPPDAAGAVPSTGAAAACGLRTIPPRENGGNLDVKQLTKGAKVFFPVTVDGALFSVGDAHYAQGDGEVCLTAIEMAGSCVLKFRLHKGEAARRKIRSPYFSRSTYFANPKFALPERCLATMGMPIDAEGKNHFGDTNLSIRNALLQMIAQLEERGFTKEQAYVICSVAVDLRISNVVDVPNFVVTALLSEDIFVG